jgi:hypothetical protein
VSGDGPNNIGPPVPPLRDWLLDQGVTINGLAMALNDSHEPDMVDSFGDGYLEAYYESCVIGGPEAFVIRIDDISQFEIAIRRKLIREIASLRALTMPALYRSRARPGIDCLAAGRTPGR